MKELGLKSRIRRKRKYYSKENSKEQISPNLLMRDFKALRADEKWATDITYLLYGNRKAYLSVILDLYNLEVVSYGVSYSNNLQLAAGVVMKACLKRGYTKGVILHSDQGGCYTSRYYCKLLEKRGIRQSMSAKGNCLDNAPAECFFSHLKSELIYLEDFASMEEMIMKVEEYIDFYNNRRIQLRLNKMAPVEYRSHNIN